MTEIFTPNVFNTVIAAMLALAVIVFLALQKLEAPYGVAYSRRWGPSLSNRAGWVIMEIPAFTAFLAIWLTSPRAAETVPCVMGFLFEAHYFQRTFIFPFLMRGKSRMPVAITLMGMTFNTINAYLLAGWIFRLSPEGMYAADWLLSPQFIAGTILFITGMLINLHSDNIIRHLRKPGDTRHYIPHGGLYKYVAAANYTGELIEWVGYAVLTWSMAGVVFAIWTFANLAPRARKLHERYAARFGEEYLSLHRHYLLPFIY